MPGSEYMDSKPLTGYTEDSENESLLSEDDHRFAAHDSTRRSKRRYHIIAAAFLLIITSSIAGGIGVYIATKYRHLDRDCALHTTQYSPLLQDVEVKYEPKMFNGTFMQEDIYRQPAGPEVDAAWEALGVDYRSGVISYGEGVRSGLTSAHVQRADKYGGGFFVNVEGLHHLHCLNLLRKSLYYNYDHYKDLGTHAFKNDEHILQLHVSHCLDILRQVLMCNVDTGVLGQVWYNHKDPKAFPDFNTKHTCKNYDAVRTWAQSKQEPVPESLPSDYMKAARPEDVYPEMP